MRISTRSGTPDFRVRVVADAGHMLMWDKLDGFAAAVAQALGEP